LFIASKAGFVTTFDRNETSRTPFAPGLESALDPVRFDSCEMSSCAVEKFAPKLCMPLYVVELWTAQAGLVPFVL